MAVVTKKSNTFGEYEEIQSGEEMPVDLHTSAILLGDIESGKTTFQFLIAGDAGRYDDPMMGRGTPNCNWISSRVQNLGFLDSDFDKDPYRDHYHIRTNIANGCHTMIAKNGRQTQSLELLEFVGLS